MPAQRMGSWLLLAMLAGCQGNIQGSVPGEDGTVPPLGGATGGSAATPGPGFDTKS